MSKENDYLVQMLKPMQALAKYDPKNPPDYDKATENAEKLGNKIAPGAEVTPVTLNGIDCESISAAGNPTDRVILYIHGGGFTNGSASSRRSLTTVIAVRLGLDVISPNYRLAPRHPYPAGLDDCVAVYKALLDQYGAANIVVAGESAGGTLTLALTVRAKQEGLPVPRALIAASPVAQIDQEFPSHTENLPTDYILQNILEETRDMYPPKNDPSVLRDPTLAPYYADFAGFPPTILSASSTEVLRDDSVFLSDKMKDAGVDVTLSMREGMQHAYVLFQSLPEAQEELECWRNFLKQQSFI